jgi:protein TonB
MKSVLFCFILLIQSVVFSQEDTTIYSTVDKEAEFPGGGAALNVWLMQNMTFINENELPTSKIFFELIIEADGTLSSIKNVRGLKLTDENIQKLISSSPKWTPAQVNGRNVRFKYYLPISCLYLE